MTHFHFNNIEKYKAELENYIEWFLGNDCDETCIPEILDFLYEVRSVVTSDIKEQVTFFNQDTRTLVSLNMLDACSLVRPWVENTGTPITIYWEDMPVITIAWEEPEAAFYKAVRNRLLEIAEEKEEEEREEREAWEAEQEEAWEAEMAQRRELSRWINEG